MKQTVLLLFIFYELTSLSQELNFGFQFATQVPTMGEFRDIGKFSPFSVDKHLIGGNVSFVSSGKHLFYNAEAGILSDKGNRLLNIPLTVHVFFGDIFKAYLILGGFTSIRLMSSDNYYRNFDLGLDYGIGAEYRLSNHIKVFSEYNMYYGILPFERDQDFENYYSSSYALLHVGVKYIIIR